MTRTCDRCGGVRINGTPVTYDDGSHALAHGGTPRAEVVGYWCRECATDAELTY